MLSRRKSGTFYKGLDISRMRPIGVEWQSAGGEGEKRSYSTGPRHPRSCVVHKDWAPNCLTAPLGNDGHLQLAVPVLHLLEKSRQFVERNLTRNKV